jgi:hypothetical protein
MYKAVQVQEGREIVILDSYWAKGIEHLRALDQHDLLVCQGCKQPVRVRAGDIRRWHFAHKQLLTCTYGRESPVLLTARAVLYEWLVSKFGEKVTVEKKVDETYFSRPVDCWVEKDNEALAYWILETAAPPQTRDALRDGFRRLAAVVHGVFLAQMLHEDEEMPNWVQLTTTEREFMRHTVYDDIVSQGVPGGQSLHYLDAETRTLTTFRGLQLVHAPHVFAGQKERHALSTMQVSPKTGEFVHPGEYERRKRYQQEQAHFAHRRWEVEAARTRRREPQRSTAGERQQGEVAGPALPEADEPSPPAEAVSAAGASSPAPDQPGSHDRVGDSAVQREAVCALCGNTTSNWWYFDPSHNTCKCYACYRQGKY